MKESLFKDCQNSKRRTSKGKTETSIWRMVTILMDISTETSKDSFCTSIPTCRELFQNGLRKRTRRSKHTMLEFKKNGMSIRKSMNPDIFVRKKIMIRIIEL